MHFLCHYLQVLTKHMKKRVKVGKYLILSCETCKSSKCFVAKEQENFSSFLYSVCSVYTDNVYIPTGSNICVVMQLSEKFLLNYQELVFIISFISVL